MANDLNDTDVFASHYRLTDPGLNTQPLATKNKPAVRLPGTEFCYVHAVAPRG